MILSNASLKKTNLGSERPKQKIIESPFFEPHRKLARFASWGYIPTPQQWLCHVSKKIFLGLFAGARFGKTLFAANEIMDTLLYPNSKTWLCGMSYDHTNREFEALVDLLARIPVDKRKTLLDICHVVMTSKGSRMVQTPWHSTVTTKATWGQNAKRNLGSSLDLIVLCEGDLIQLNIFTKYLVPRLSDRQGRIILPTTPSCDHGVVKFFKEEYAKGNPNFECHTFSVLDNPYINPERIALLKEFLDEGDYKEQVGGEVVHRVGLVFSEWRDSLHLFDTLPHSIAALPTIICVRFRFNEPSCLVAMKYDRKSRSCYVFEEYVCTTSDPNMLKEKMEAIRSAPNRIVGAVCGSDDPLSVSEMRRVGVSLLRVERKGDEKSKLKTLVTETSSLKNALKHNIPLSYNLYVSTACPLTIKEFQNCRWPEHRGSSIVAPEVPSLRNFFLSRAVSHGLLFLGDFK